jgi:hypothetical protein
MTAPDIDVSDFDYEFVTAEPDRPEPPDVTTEVSSDFADAKKETARAAQYRKKVSRGLANIWRPLLQDPNTINDAAAILNYGPDFARAIGELADRDAKARRIIDFASDGMDNPYANVLIAGIPLIAQLMRNHEDKLDIHVRTVKIPFLKRQINLKFGIKLGRFRNLTYEPSYITQHVLSDQKLIDILAKQGIKIGWPTDATADANGSKSNRRFRTRA